jgi:hypothetical protein
VVGSAPRALRHCAPSAPPGASVRPLNFTVRAHVTRMSKLWCHDLAHRHAPFQVGLTRKVVPLLGTSVLLSKM